MLEVAVDKALMDGGRDLATLSRMLASMEERVTCHGECHRATCPELKIWPGKEERNGIFTVSPSILLVRPPLRH